MAFQMKNDWNYGNAIHHGHIFLGRIVLRLGDIEKAKMHLLQAGRTPGSPQLRSFGPNMTLAKDLLEKGETEVVLEFIDMCKKFWWFIFRVIPIRRWKNKILKGQLPNFGAHLSY